MRTTQRLYSLRYFVLEVIFMLKNILGIGLVVVGGATFLTGQTPEPKVERLLTPDAFAFSFDGNGGYLGVQTVEVTKDNFSKYALRGVRGVAIEKVAENSPAAAAGLKDGDVILRVNGDEITSTRKLTRLISEIEPDHQARLTISRGGSEQEITATLGKRPTPKFGEGNFRFEGPEAFGKLDLDNFPQLKNLPRLKDFDFKNLPDGEGFRSFSFPGGEGRVFSWTNGRQIGVGVSPLTAQLAKHFGVESGLMINEVRENSPAAKAGLKAGDIIVEANGKAVKGDFDLIGEVNRNKEGDVSLVIVRSGSRQTISVTPEASKDSGFFFRNEDGDGKILTPKPPKAPAAPISPLQALRWNRMI